MCYVQVELPPLGTGRLRGQKLPVENDRMTPGAGQPADTDRIPPKDLGRNVSWIIAGTENDNLGVRDLA